MSVDLVVGPVEDLLADDLGQAHVQRQIGGLPGRVEERPLRQQDFGRDIMGSDGLEAVILENLHQARHHVAVTASKHPDDPRQETDRCHVGRSLAEDHSEA